MKYYKWLDDPLRVVPCPFVCIYNRTMWCYYSRDYEAWIKLGPPAELDEYWEECSIEEVLAAEVEPLTRLHQFVLRVGDET